jgi:metal-responsive CopG/Arc/MetJ family transcriptional regulator
MVVNVILTRFIKNRDGSGNMKQFTVRLDDTIEKEFNAIKDDIGLKTDAELVRVLIRDEYRRRFPEEVKGKP